MAGTVMAIKLRCPECHKAFAWDTQLPWPSACPFADCQAEMSSDKATAPGTVAAPYIRSVKTKATDQVYRDIEQASERRVEQAAEMAGVPTSEMEGLKITDLGSSRHEGEVAARDVHNPVSDFMAANPQAGGFRGADGVGYSGAVQSGPSPNMGAKMRSLLQQQHGAAIGGAAVSDRPALETMQPGYRRRG